MYDKFKMLLNQNNVKVSDVSKATGISTSTFTDWKKGRYAPKADKLKAIAEYFGVSLDYFVADDDSASLSFLLSDNEQFLILDFRKLNEEGQEKALTYIDDLVASGRYIKTDSTGVLERDS